MPNLKPVLLLALAVLAPAVALAQASPSPLPSGPPISDMDRMMRERDTNQRFHSNALATLNLTYQSSGDLRSSLVKTELQSLFMTVEVNGKQIKRIAKNDKPKVQEAVEPGPLQVTGRWARPGTRRDTKCKGDLTVGFHQVVFLPYGGQNGWFSCEIEPRDLPQEVYDQWQASLDGDEAGAFDDCASQHPRGSGEFWSCIDGAGVPFPQA